MKAKIIVKMMSIIIVMIVMVKCGYKEKIKRNRDSINTVKRSSE